MVHKYMAKDFLINIASSMLYTLVSQFVVYPVLANRSDIATYGTLLTIMGLINVLFSSIGNTLNNTRLIRNREYSQLDREGNFNILTLIASIGGAIFFSVIAALFFHLSISLIIPLFFLLVVGISRAYFVVFFRMHLDFTRQLISNIILISGYLGSIFIIQNMRMWYLPFLVGELLSLLYIIFIADLIKENWGTTRLFSDVRSLYFSLIIMSTLGNIILYFDRFLIYPLLGQVSVSIYTVASFWGKSLTAFIDPVANFLLSYLSQKGYKMTLRQYVQLFFLGFFPVFIFGIAGYYFAPIIIRFLYPTIFSQAKPYIFLASNAILIGIITNLIMPSILTNVAQKKILIIQVCHFIIYSGLAIIFAKKWAIWGFCYATIIANTLKVVALFFLGFFAVKQNNIVLKKV